MHVLLLLQIPTHVFKSERKGHNYFKTDSKKTELDAAHVIPEIPSYEEQGKPETLERIRAHEVQ